MTGHAYDHDLVVIGGGSAGLTAADFAARLGARVLLVDREKLGGDCTWTGCIPSKALLAAARVAQAMRSAAAFGLPGCEPQVDLGAVMAVVREAIERVSSSETPEHLAPGVEVAFGGARFLGPNSIQIGEGRIVRAPRFLIATGASPARPPIPGLDSCPYLTHQDLFTQTELPPRLVVLGAGPIGVEMAQAFQRLGSEVTLVETAGEILPAADPEAAAILHRRLEAEGMRVLTGRRVVAVARRGNLVTLQLEGGAPAGRDVHAEKLLIATGRRPHTDGLDPAAAGVRSGPDGVAVDGNLRTSQAHIYAAGDVTGSFQFTHYAGWQGFQAARNLLVPTKKAGTRSTVPWVVFTDPEVAQAGQDEPRLLASGQKYEVHRWAHARNDRAQTAGESETLLKILSAPGSGRVLGATMVAGWGGELVNEMSLAIERGLSMGDLADSIHAYPTYGMAIQQAAAEAVLVRFSGSAVGKALRRIVL